MWPPMATSKAPKRGSKSKPRRTSPPAKEIQPPAVVPPPAPPDPNMSDPRLLLNRPCIYERRLPSGAHIAAYAQRLQHGFYANEAVSDMDSEHVDFLGISFVFHSAQTNNHRFKSALIKLSISSDIEQASRSDVKDLNYHAHTIPRPRFLMHAPHLLYGTVSPETMQWNFSVAGALGVSEGPVNASIIPSGGMNGRYNRYEMMRIQGSARTRKSAHGREFDTESGEVVWSLEENTLDRTGLPREFTFVLLVHKPAVDSRVNLDINIEPVLQSRVGNYPNWMLSLPAYQAMQRNGVDFNKEIGQRFLPIVPGRGFNFAGLKSAFDDYMAMPGRHHSRTIEIPKDNPNQYNNYPQGNYQQGYNPGWGFNPSNLLSTTGTQFSAENAPENVLRAQLNSMPMGIQDTGGGSQRPPRPIMPPLPGGNTMNLNIILGNPAQPLSREQEWQSPAATIDGSDDEATPEESNEEGQSEGWLAALRLEDGERARVVAGKCHEEDHEEDQKSDIPSLPMLQDASRQVMSMANVPVTNTMLSSLAGDRQKWGRQHRRTFRNRNPR